MSAACMLGSRVALAGASVRPPRGRGRNGKSPAAAAVPRASIAEPTKPSDASEDEKRAKVSMVSLGCPKNTVDGEVMLGDLFSNGFDVVDDHEEADAVIVNTCGFVEDAKNESVDAILAAAALKAESGQKKKVVVTGCLAQRYAEDLAEELPEVDIVMGFEEYKNLPSTVGTMLGVETNADPSANRGRVRVGTASPPFRPEALRKRLTPQHYAYLRVAEGCDHKCTFCAIPGFRGKFPSKPWDLCRRGGKGAGADGRQGVLPHRRGHQPVGHGPQGERREGLAELLGARGGGRVE